jgi:hypothetical protein
VLDGWGVHAVWARIIAHLATDKVTAGDGRIGKKKEEEEKDGVNE